MKRIVIVYDLETDQLFQSIMWEHISLSNPRL